MLAFRKLCKRQDLDIGLRKMRVRKGVAAMGTAGAQLGTSGCLRAPTATEGLTFGQSHRLPPIFVYVLLHPHSFIQCFASLHFQDFILSTLIETGEHKGFIYLAQGF